MKEDTLSLVGKPLPKDAPPVRDSVHVAVVSLVCGAERYGMSPGQRFKLAHGTEHHDFPTALLADYEGSDAVGVVDPYLFARDQHRYHVEPGEKFLGFLFPGTVTGLTHRWDHPAFKPKDTAPPPLSVMTKEGRREAFLRAIAEHPEDEAPHLEYADWLMEQGEDEAAQRHKEWDTHRQKAWDWLHGFAEKWNFNFDEMMNATHMVRWGATEMEYVTALGHDLNGPGELGDGELEKFWECVSTATGQTFTPEQKANLGWSCSC